MGSTLLEILLTSTELYHKEYH